MVMFFLVSTKRTAKNTTVKFSRQNCLVEVSLVVLSLLRAKRSTMRKYTDLPFTGTGVRLIGSAPLKEGAKPLAREFLFCVEAPVLSSSNASALSEAAELKMKRCKLGGRHPTLAWQPGRCPVL